MSKGICVIIPAYNERECIGDTLTSLRSQTLLPEMIVVVDDGSKDGTGEYIKKNFPEVVVIRPVKNLGSKAKAQNFALFYRKNDGSLLIKSRFIVSIDADTSVNLDGIELLSKPLRENRKIKASCGTVIPRNLDNAYTLGRLGEYLCAFAFPKRIQQAYGGNILILSGCFGCYRIGPLRRRRGWHTKTMAEDMDLTASYHKKCLKVAYVHEAICRPIEPFNWRTYSTQMTRWNASFFQIISLHWKTYVNRPVGIFLIVCFLDAFIGGAIWYLTPLWMFLAGFKEWIKWFILVDLFLVSIPIVYMGIKLKILKEAIKSIPFIYFLRSLNYYFWCRAFYLEWIKKEHLKVFIKGH